jgi:hypothetical protein
VLLVLAIIWFDATFTAKANRKFAKGIFHFIYIPQIANVFGQFKLQHIANMSLGNAQNIST